jgi:chemotaxis protein CheC
MNSELSTFERDMLLEAASITAGKTIKAINNIIKQHAAIALPQLELIGIEHITDSMGKPQDIKTMVLIRIIGEAQGAVVLVVDPNDLPRLLSNVDEKLRISALEEMTNVMAGAALGSLSKMLNILFLQSIPASTTDMLRAAMSEITGELGEKSAKVLCMTTKIQIGPDKILASMHVLFDTDTTAKVLAAGERIAGRHYG